MENKRTEYIHIRLTPEEKEKFNSRMKEAEMNNLSEFIRHMVKHGYILKLDVPELKEMLRLLGNATSNINQIARRVNSTDNFYAEDITEISKQYQDLSSQMQKITRKLFGSK